MNFRILAASVWPRGRVFAVLATTILAVSFFVAEAQAQAPAPAVAPKPKPKAAPKPAAPAPAQAAPPAAGAPPAGQPQEQALPQLIYAPWTKFCVKSPDANAKQLCLVGKEGRIESGQPVVSAVIIETEGEPKQTLRVTVPLGMELFHGTRIIVDSNQPLQSPFGTCLPNGCMAEYELTPELLANLKKGQNLLVQAINNNNAALTLPLPLQEKDTGNSFAKAYDGPATDPKVYEENQKKLQEELQKRAAEARAKLQQAAQPNGAAPNPAAK